MVASSIFQVAQSAISNPDVQEMVKKLSEYGLGICMPHMHDSTGNFAPLPPGIVSFESDLQVSFHKACEVSDSPAVAWRWDDDKQTVVPCSKCDVGRWHCIPNQA
ncbi:hypothetical protein SD81_016850 [Tolypothrix campylonemoides VB511288]|nr:hypothetical protein SD81_016850 [Tolypothrix campylonemoides VB511288]